jgi:hypothetical protein
VVAAEKKGSIPGNMRFASYTGYDALDWETSVGALADTSYKLPVYRGWPSKPYVVLGDVRHQDPHKQWEEGELKDAVRAARAVGGDAVIIRRGAEAGVQAITGTVNVGVYAQSMTTALIIRWQTEEEIQGQRQRDQALLEQLKAAEPGLAVSEQTGGLAVKYLLRSGLQESSTDFFLRFQQLVKRIHRTNDTPTGQWLFKATMKTTGIASQNERSFMGIAAVTADANSLAVVSLEGETEASFSGRQTGSQLNGQLGLAGHSAKAEGVVVGDKISVTFHTIDQNGTVQGTFVLQR